MIYPNNLFLLYHSFESQKNGTKKTNQGEGIRQFPLITPSYVVPRVLVHTAAQATINNNLS